MWWNQSWEEKNMTKGINNKKTNEEKKTEKAAGDWTKKREEKKRKEHLCALQWEGYGLNPCWSRLFVKKCLLKKFYSPHHQYTMN